MKIHWKQGAIVGAAAFAIGIGGARIQAAPLFQDPQHEDHARPDEHARSDDHGQDRDRAVVDYSRNKRYRRGSARVRPTAPITGITAATGISRETKTSAPTRPATRSPTTDNAATTNSGTKNRGNKPRATNLSKKTGLYWGRPAASVADNSAGSWPSATPAYPAIYFPFRRKHSRPR